MQLTFLGQPYTITTSSVDIQEVPIQITFLGQSSVIQQCYAEPFAQQTVELMYRGVSYTPIKGRPGQPLVNSRRLLQQLRSRRESQRHPAFRSSYSR